MQTLHSAVQNRGNKNKSQYLFCSGKGQKKNLSAGGKKVSKRVKVRQKRAKGRFLRNGKICQAFAEKPKGLFVFSFFVIVGKQQQQPDDDACSDHDVKVLVVRIIVC